MSAKTALDVLEQERIRLYLLGAVPAAERQAIQDRMFRDEAFFALMRLTEIDLIDSLAAGWLPANAIEPARRFVVESSQPEAFAAAAALAAAFENRGAEDTLLDQIRQRFS